MENKILVHADINLNVVDGATIWWSNIINVFIQGGIDIIYISNYKIINHSNLRNIENKSKLTFINPDKNLNPAETLKKIEEYGNQVNKVILRSNLILAIINENWNLLNKTIIYGLDIHLNNIKKLNNKFKKVWTQSEKLKKLFEKNGINKVKIVPVVAYKYNFNLPKRIDNETKLIYTGTLRDEENIIEIIEEFQNIHKKHQEVVLKIVYGKIHGNNNFINKINTYIKNGVKGITFKTNLSHKDASYEIATSDIGICWRKNGWGDNGEVSTKIKEYQVYGLKVINNLNNLFNIITLNTAYFLYGAKVLNLGKKINYINNNINIKLIPFKCNKINDIIDSNIKKIMNTPDSKLLDNYSGSFKNKINEVLIKYSNNNLKRITNKYQYGHINSFINLINNAKQNNLREIIIFEDDILFHKNIKTHLSNFDTIKKEVDIIYFGASKHKDYYVNNSTYQCRNITGTFAIFLKDTIFDDYLELLKLNILPSDICLSILQNKYKTYVYEPDIIISDLDNSKITQRINIGELYKQFKWNINDYINYENEYILIVLPTFNRSENIENIINMINNQSYKYYNLLIIDDGSNNKHKSIFNNIKNKYKDNLKIIFKENDKNMNIANTLNKGLKFLIDDTTTNYKFFTWISDDNIYHDTFLEELIKDNKYFKYSAFNLVNKINKTTKKIDIKYNIESLINDFNGCASFMWTKEAIKTIGFYNSNINGCEDWEYLIRTFQSNGFEYSYENTPLMDYIRTNDSLYIRENSKIIDLKNNITKIFNYLKNEQSNIIYYSKTNYKLLFQRPQQIMRFFDKEFNKVFIGNIENVEIDEKYKLLIVPYNLKDCVFNFINKKEKYLYYTDSRLYDEIITRTEYKKIYDLIDAPIDEFEVWKPNLEKCVKQSDYVMYSHPELVNYLNKIDNTKTYYYISNGCDYEHFSKAKNRIGERPIEFPQTNKPILGYYGSFSKWLDYDLIRKYADEGTYYIIMIGGIPNNPNYNIRFNHPNIRWLDHKSYDELPYYLSWFDKCLLPFKDYELTKYVNPCKLWEYMASEKEIIKSGINIEHDEIIKYENECKKIMNILNNNIKFLIVLDKYKKGGLEKHTEILKKELNCDIMVFNSSEINHKKINNENYKNYDVILWQNTFNILPEKQKKQKYIYIVHSQCDWWSEKNKKNIKKNNNFIDYYIFVSDSIKQNFEKNIFIPVNSYVIENQLEQIENDKKKISGLFISCGSYNELKGHFELIQEFSKLDKNTYILEIYGDIHDINYYDKLNKYINNNQLFNIKLFEYTDNYLERLKEAEYFCLFSKSEGCSYAILEAMSLNKKIICSEECITFNQIKWYPNKIIHKLNDSLFNWFSIDNNNFILYKNNFNCYKKIINKNNKLKIGKYIVNKIEDVLDDLNSGNYKDKKKGYSFLIRIKNEEETIKKCILDIVDIADEIIIVDNQSTDKTLSIILELEKIYDNIFVYQYLINIPRYGIEHIENFKKNDINKHNTLTNYYNWTASKATYNKKIKWDGDFYCIRNNLIKLLNKYKNYNENEIAIWFSGLTLFINNDDRYLKKESYYNEFRLFLNNNNNNIWSDNIWQNKNYCETSYKFSKKCKIKEYFLEPIFIEIKNTNKDEFNSRSFIDVNDNRDNIDYQILYSLSNNIPNDNIIKINEIYDMYKYFNLFSKNKNIFINYENKIEYEDILFFKKKEIILLNIDSFGWAFDNISEKIKKYCENDTKIIKITTYPELYDKIYNNYLKNKYRMKYSYCNIDLNLIDHVIFFWYGGGNIDILKYIKNNKNIKSINLAIYDYSKWINNIDNDEQKTLFNNINYFFKEINNVFYSCPEIKKQLEMQSFFNNNLKYYTCYDGIDTKLFTYKKYNNDIYTKSKLKIGWIGNSNPEAHGINKGFKIIEEVIEKNNDKFIFEPQDSYTGVKISHNEIPNYIYNIDIIICFSVSEGTPNQILEASSCGRCWISTKVGIVEELYNTIENNPTGILINRNIEELEKALLLLYNNRKLIEKYGDNGRKAIEKEWDWSKKAKQFDIQFL